MSLTARHASTLGPAMHVVDVGSSSRTAARER
jgi:hypothetical protein